MWIIPGRLRTSQMHINEYVISWGRGCVYWSTNGGFFSCFCFSSPTRKATQIHRELSRKLTVYLDDPIHGIYSSKHCSDMHRLLCERLEIEFTRGKNPSLLDFKSKI